MSAVVAGEKVSAKEGRVGRPNRTLYDRDFAAWALQQGAAIRAGRLAELDLENVAEEIESLGREQFSKVRSAYRIILLHMLKGDHQPDRRSSRWALSIRKSRRNAGDVIEDSPSLRPRRLEAMERAYSVARLEAAEETKLKLSIFPETCPYSLDDVLRRRFDWPEE